MKRYGGSNGIPEQHCLTLGQIADGPGESGISSERLTERLFFEQSHDAEVIQATHDMRETERYQQLCVEHAGRCSCCGELIGEVDRCPLCNTQQCFAGQRNSAQRKTIGGFCSGSS